MSVFSKVISHSEKTTGLTVSEIRSYSPEQLRFHIEKKNKKKVTFGSEFPVIGRGNVLRDSLISNDSLNHDIDEILSRG